MTEVNGDLYFIVAEKYQVPVLCDEVYAHVVSFTSFFSSCIILNALIIACLTVAGT